METGQIANAQTDRRLLRSNKQVNPLDFVGKLIM